MGLFNSIRFGSITRMLLLCFFVGLSCGLPGTELPTFEECLKQVHLPDPLVMMDGTRVQTREDWFGKRRPELKRMFQHYVYGYLPPKPEMKVFVIQRNELLLDGKATYEEIELHLELPVKRTHTIHLALFLPNHLCERIPVFIALNKCGNHTVIDDTCIAIVERPWLHSGCQNNSFKRGSRIGMWALENTIEKGFALATFAVADMDPDRHDWTDGIHAKYPDPPGDEDTRWGMIAAWAWGIHRVVDYMEADRRIDQDRICVTGLSRRGKTALFAGAMDERIDLVIPHQSGTGGMALSRMHPSESVARINEKFPHWFNDNFARFGSDIERLPLDQHLLVALVAPRPLMDNAGLQDTLASSHLALKAMKAASPVYELLGEKGVVGEGFVRDEIGDGPVGRLLQYQRDTEHGIDIDYWNTMIEFANRQLGKSE